MSDLFFVDSNILIYQRDATEPIKQPLAAGWMESLWRTRRGRLSMQVLHEFYHVVTKKLRPGMDVAAAKAEVRDFFAWEPVTLSTKTLEQAWQNEKEFGLSFWDSLIVAAAAQSGCRYLLSEDLQTGQNLNGIEVMNPFVNPPPAT